MSFILKQFCDMCEEGFNHMKEMIPYHGFVFCSTKCVDKYKNFIREFLMSFINDEGTSDIFKWGFELALKELEEGK